MPLKKNLIAVGVATFLNCHPDIVYVWLQSGTRKYRFGERESLTCGVWGTSRGDHGLERLCVRGGIEATPKFELVGLIIRCRSDFNKPNKPNKPYEPSVWELYRLFD